MKQFLVNSYLRLKETNIFSNFVNLSSIQLSNALLLILIYPIITRIIGIEAFGVVMVANTFAGLAAIVINYGTNQSGIRDVAKNTNKPDELGKIFYNVLWIRLLIFILFILFLFCLQWFNIRYYGYILFAIPIVLSEVLNPLFFFIGAENLRIYNMANLVSKILIILLIILLIKGGKDAAWVNFIMGITSCLTYVILAAIIMAKYKLPMCLPQQQEIKHIGRENFFLTVNNISVHLQQSLMVFALAKWGTAPLLGAYSLCDKIVGSTRILIIAISSSVYPKAAQLYQQKPLLWKFYMNRMKVLIGVLFFCSTLLLFIFSEYIVLIMVGEPNETAVIFLRIMAFVPTAAALNSLNVVDLLVRNNTRSIFNIAIILLIISVLASYSLVQSNYYHLYGCYTLVLELSALFMYEFAIQKARKYKTLKHT